MLGVVGDLMTDVVVRLKGDIRYGTDADAEVIYRRGGSAANLSVIARKLGADVAFFGNVGKDIYGDELIKELEAEGVKMFVTRSGVTGTVIAVLDSKGERTMLTDRGSSKDYVCEAIDEVGQISFLHIPGYSLLVEPLGSTSIELAKLADRVSVGISSVGAVSDFGLEKFWELVRQIKPDIIICNKAEAEYLGDEKIMEFMTVATQGASPTQIYAFGDKLEIQPHQLTEVSDTTGAGDAFTAGLLVELLKTQSSPEKIPVEILEDAVKLGHSAVADLLKQRAN